MCCSWFMNNLQHTHRKEMIMANKIVALPQTTNKINKHCLLFAIFTVRCLNSKSHCTKNTLKASKGISEALPKI